jgi:hypothetical protein
MATISVPAGSFLYLLFVHQVCDASLLLITRLKSFRTANAVRTPFNNNLQNCSGPNVGRPA